MDLDEAVALLAGTELIDPTSRLGEAREHVLHELDAMQRRARAIRDSATGTDPVASPAARTAIRTTAQLILGEEPT